MSNDYVFLVEKVNSAFLRFLCARRNVFKHLHLATAFRVIGASATTRSSATAEGPRGVQF